MNARFDALWAGLHPNSEGLMPCITQDLRTRAVLMMAWVSKQALRLTLERGYAVYYSRSRQALWEKGSQSGKRQRIIQVRLDTDQDTLLYMVDAVLPACHDGSDTYFNLREDQGRWRLDPIELRLQDDLRLLKPQGEQQFGSDPEAMTELAISPPKSAFARDLEAGGQAFEAALHNAEAGQALVEAKALVALIQARLASVGLQLNLPPRPTPPRAAKRRRTQAQLDSSRERH